MADLRSMTVSESAGKMLTGEHADVVREAVRLAQRNGYRQRQWDTRVGSLELAIPRLRSGSYFPSFLEPRWRSEQALVAVVAEAYVNGVSTRKVERLVAQLGIESMSRSTVSRLCKTLDEQVRIFRERPLEGRYPYLWLDAKVERVREAGSVHHKALVVAYGVHESGCREVIGIDAGEAETKGLLARVPARPPGPWPR
jgi:putative transposase